MVKMDYSLIIQGVHNNEIILSQNKTTVIKTVSLSFFSLTRNEHTSLLEQWMPLIQSAGNHFSPIFTAEREFSKLGYPVMLWL